MMEIAEASLGQRIFGDASLKDARHTARLVKSFDRMCLHPGGTLPEKFGAPADLQAFYRLCDRARITHGQVIEAAREHTLRRCAAEASEVILCLHDETELDYTTLKSLANELGQIGKGTRRGYICHNVVAVSASGEMWGMMDQILHKRVIASAKESLAERRRRESRESRLWVTGTKHLPADWRIVDVADQASDTFEFLEHEFHSGRRFVVRAYKPREVYAGHVATGESRALHAYASELPERGRYTLDVQAQEGRVARSNAEFVVRCGPVLVLPPSKRCGLHGDQPLPLYVVLTTEVDPPPGVKPLEWMLLTNHPVETFDDAWCVLGWYEKRWVIEEFHKGQKTGCQIEDMQFTTTARLEPAIAVVSVVAQTLLNLRDLSRHPTAKRRLATTVLAPAYVEVLSLWRHKKIRLDWSVFEFCYALARLGGHQNRNSDRPPGWLVLWRGWTKLQAMLIGYEAANRKRCDKT